MNWYYVPIIGFIKAGIEMHHAQAALDACQYAGGSCLVEFDAAWVPYNNLGTSVLVTVGFCFLLRILLQIFKDQIDAFGERHRRKYLMPYLEWESKRRIGTNGNAK